MTTKVRSTIEKYHMITPGETVIAAVSGGADSMSLLHFLFSCKDELKITLLAAHVNHGLRGEDADGDEAFVRGWCEERGIPIYVHLSDIKALAQKQKLGLEECGRRVRYAFLEETARRYQNAKIATAHTLSDNTETFFMRLIRGTGTKGLCGIPPVRENIIRPLIEVTRREVEAYCERHAVAYRTDKTNFETGYTRNKIRLQVLPVLGEINPRFEDEIHGAMEQLMMEDAYLEDRAKAAWEKAQGARGADISALRLLPDVLLSRALRYLAPGSSMERVHIEALIRLVKKGTGEVSLPGKYSAAVRDGFLYVNTETEKRTPFSYPLCKALREEFGIDGVRFEITDWETFENRRKFYKLLFNNAVSYDTITDSTVFRSRRPGDTFQKAGRGLTKTVKKLFCEEKIPLDERDNLPMIANGSEVLWIQGLGVSEAAKVTKETKQILLILPKECRDVKRY